MGLFDRFKPARDEEKSGSPVADAAPLAAEETVSSPALVEQPDDMTEAASIVAPETTDSEVELSPTVPSPPAPEVAAPFVDFESEFAELVPSAAAETAPVTEPLAPVLDDADLEEWSEPLPSASPPVLAEEALLQAPEGALKGALKIETWLEARGSENVYRASWQGEGDVSGAETVVRLREATGDWGERLSREAMWRAHWEATARIAMLPPLVCSFKQEENVYLATEQLSEGPSLAQFFATQENQSSPLDLETDVEEEKAAFLSEILLVATQIAAFLVRLHGAGFAHLGLRPEGIILGKPVQILDCSFAAPLGEPLEAPLSIAGYSAPELSRPGVVDARSDLYAVGALLYRAVTGADVPESGADFTTWQPRIVMAGVPQILRRTLGETDTRYNSAEELHRALVKLKNRLRPTLSQVTYGLSTIGLEGSRATNQDAFGWQGGAWETDQGPVAWTAFCVCDGMGGMAAGEVASEVAVATFLRAASLWSVEAAALNSAPLPAATQAQLVKEWAALANEAVVKAMEARRARGGCTLDAGLVIDRRLCLAHVGDARFYLFRAREFQLLSRDHSFVMSLLLQGQISFDDIRTHNERNKITRSLGERHPQPDYFVDDLQTQTGQAWLDLQPGDVLMACSDGLWEPVLESEMLAALESGDLPRAARDMLRLALQRGAPDNATLVLFRLDEQPAPVFA